ncbi:MAG: hypothetical protein ABFD66_09175 [Smithella sp.]
MNEQEQKEYLFIGGSIDGQRKWVNGCPNIILISILPKRKDSIDVSSGIVKNEIYRLEKIMVQSKSFDAYIKNDLTLAEAFSLLMHHYKSTNDSSGNSNSTMPNVFEKGFLKNPDGIG